jgi:hypothetical protein
LGEYPSRMECTWVLDDLRSAIFNHAVSAGESQKNSNQT